MSSSSLSSEVFVDAVNSDIELLDAFNDIFDLDIDSEENSLSDSSEMEIDSFNLTFPSYIFDLPQADILLNDAEVVVPVMKCMDDNEEYACFESSEGLKTTKMASISKYYNQQETDYMKLERKPDSSPSPPYKRRTVDAASVTPYYGSNKEEIHDLQYKITLAQFNTSVQRSAYTRNELRRHRADQGESEPSYRRNSHLGDTPAQRSAYAHEQIRQDRNKLIESQSSYETRNRHLDSEKCLRSRSLPLNRGVGSSFGHSNRVDGLLLGSRTTLTIGLEQSRNVLKAYLGQVGTM